MYPVYLFSKPRTSTSTTVALGASSPVTEEREHFRTGARVAQRNNGEGSPWESSCRPRMMAICPPFLEKGPIFTFLWGRVKRISVSGFKGEILRLGDKMMPECLNSECPSSPQLGNTGSWAAEPPCRPGARQSCMLENYDLNV